MSVPTNTFIERSTYACFAALITQAWEDDNFKKELLANPRAVLEAHGYSEFKTATGATVTVVVIDESASNNPSGKLLEYSDTPIPTLTLYLPAKPTGLDQVRFSGQFTPAYFT